MWAKKWSRGVSSEDISSILGAAAVLDRLLRQKTVFFRECLDMFLVHKRCELRMKHVFFIHASNFENHYFPLGKRWFSRIHLFLVSTFFCWFLLKSVKILSPNKRARFFSKQRPKMISGDLFWATERDPNEHWKSQKSPKLRKTVILWGITFLRDFGLRPDDFQELLGTSQADPELAGRPQISKPMNRIWHDLARSGVGIGDNWCPSAPPCPQTPKPPNYQKTGRLSIWSCSHTLDRWRVGGLFKFD